MKTSLLAFACSCLIAPLTAVSAGEEVTLDEVANVCPIAYSFLHHDADGNDELTVAELVKAGKDKAVIKRMKNSNLAN